MHGNHEKSRGSVDLKQTLIVYAKTYFITIWFPRSRQLAVPRSEFIVPSSMPPRDRSKSHQMPIAKEKLVKRS